MSDLQADGFGLPFWEQIPIETQHRWVNTLGWSDFQEYVKSSPHLAVLLTYWPLRYEGLVGEGEFREAVGLFSDNVSEPGIPGDVDGIELVSLERQYQATQDDTFRGFLLIKKYLELGDEAAALDLLREIRSANRELPEFAHYWEGELSRRASDLPAAAAAWSRWLLAHFGRGDS